MHVSHVQCVRLESHINNVSSCLQNKESWLFAHHVTFTENNCPLPLWKCLEHPHVWWSIVKGNLRSPYCCYPCHLSPFCDLWDMTCVVLFPRCNTIKANSSLTLFYHMNRCCSSKCSKSKTSPVLQSRFNYSLYTAMSAYVNSPNIPTIIWVLSFDI